MKPYLCLLLLVVAVGGTVRADATTPFPQVGYSYLLRAPVTSPLTHESANAIAQNGAGPYSAAFVKVLAISPNQWCWVEYDVVSNPDAAKSGPVTIEKHREWLNFAAVTSATPKGEIDYGATYPNGFRIVPYSGP